MLSSILFKTKLLFAKTGSFDEFLSKL